MDTTLDAPSAWEAVAGMVDGPRLVEALREVIEQARSQGSAPRVQIIGPPGSGRSTLARHLGPVFAAEGLVPRRGGVEVSAVTWRPTYVGKAGEVARATMSSAGGGTLLVQDAPRMGGTSDGFGASPVEALVAELAGPNWHDTAVVLIGEPGPMAELAAEKPALAEHFAHRLVRTAYDASHCVDLLAVLLGAGERPQTAEPAFVAAFEDLARAAASDPGFDSGDWVVRVLDAALIRMRRRVMTDPERFDAEGRRRLVLDDLVPPEIPQTHSQGS
ncbi:hypothetical protein [Nocardioides sp. W7]|uniref:hypothetical protein n=1 Tax=Nocardioides sp. W7 TaxID=2931390 RepID=UPI001FD0E1F0|nr:hypothetical protein [Nocardioides sp. W7]